MERTYKIVLLGETCWFTLFELKWILTREAYDLYFRTLRQGGLVSFGTGAMCTDEFFQQLLD